ncbi:MAG: molybdopterin-dependent oxidoreductase, partial [Acidimicrobiia bacterium]
TYTLAITGMVDRPLTLTYQELIDRPLVESDITLTCVSNEVGGKLVGNARWLGVRLDDLLDEAGIAPGADQIVGRSVDRYTCGFPVSALDGRDALVAIAMNGEPLPPEHGFPARLIVPGLYGYVSATKWLAEIELTTFDQFDHYWVDRGWDAEAPIKTQSRIDTPSALGRIAPGTTAIAGVAWAQTRGIDRVEVRIDDGPWQDAELAAELNDTTWRQWKLAWDATPGRHEISCRATDRTGTTQTEERTRPIPNGASGWHSIVVIVEA